MSSRNTKFRWLNRRKEERQKEATARQRTYSRLSIAERIAQLDVRLGKGMGAVKERAKLAKLLKGKEK